MNPPIKALLFTATAGYRHTCIHSLATSLSLLPSLDLTHTESLSALISLLPLQDVLILGHNTGDYLDEAGKEAVRRFVDGGRRGRNSGVVGIHAATSGMKRWRWYAEMLGGAFSEHPEPQWGVVRVHDVKRDPVGNRAEEVQGHFIVSGLPEPSSSSVPLAAPQCPAGLQSTYPAADFPWYDEWYNFHPEPRIPPKGSTVLISVDKTTYQGWNGHQDQHETQHPLAWCHELRGGTRVFYTALGHFEEAYEDPWFMAILEKGIVWAARREG